jgi:hypothetical protein
MSPKFTKCYYTLAASMLRGEELSTAVAEGSKQIGLPKGLSRVRMEVKGRCAGWVREVFFGFS